MFSWIPRYGARNEELRTDIEEYESEKERLKNKLIYFLAENKKTPNYEEIKPHLIALIYNISSLLQQVEKIKKTSEPDYRRAKDILASCNTILNTPSRKNIKDHNDLADKVLKDSKWCALYEAMAIMGSTVLIITSVLVCVGICAALSGPAVIGMVGGLYLFMGGIGFSNASSEAKLCKTMHTLAEEAPWVPRRSASLSR